MYIRVTKASGVPPVRVTLSGPTDIIQKIYREHFDLNKTVQVEKLGGSMKITVSGDDVTFMIATSLEEVCKYRFVHEDTWANVVKKDFILLSRRVKLC